MPRPAIGTLVIVLLLGARSFAEEEPAPADTSRAEIHALLTELQKAANAEDDAAIARLFHAQTLVEELERQGFLQHVPEKRRVTVRRAMALRLQMGLGGNLVDPFVSFEIRRVFETESPGRQKVYVRSQDRDGWTSKTHWYVVRRPEGWRLYDLEEIDGGIRASSVMGVVLVEMLAGGVQEIRGWSSVARLLPEAFDALGEGDFEKARTLATELEGLRLPDVIGCVLQMVLATIDNYDENTEKALDRLARAQKMNPDAPGVHYIRATVLNQANRFEEALAAARTYVSLVDPDPEVNVELARALIGLKRPGEAVAPLEEALRESPGNGEALAYLAAALPDDRTGVLVAHLKKMHDKDNGFTDATDTAYAADLTDALRRLIAAGAQIVPEHRDVHYYAGVLLYDEATEVAHYKAAAKHLERAVDIVARTDLPDDTRKTYLEVYIDAMLGAEEPVAAFERAFDSRFAFHLLVLRLDDRDDAKRLRGLLEAGKEQAGVPNERRFATGAIEAHEGRHAEAVEILSSLQIKLTAAKPESDSEAESLLHEVEDQLVRSLVRTNKLDLAEALGKDIAKRDNDWRYVAIVAAKRGNVAKVREAILRGVDGEVDMVWYFEDEDLEDELKKDAYKDIRTKHYAGDDDG